MEGLKLRSFVVTGILVVFAGLVYLTPRPGKVPGRSQDWMNSVAPAKVASYSFIPSDSDPQCTYKQPQMVYDTLAPTVGILARVFQAQDATFDVTLIASRDRVSFHDPRVCFTAQGYNITEESAISIPTKTRGNIPATLAKMTTPDKAQALAVYFYKDTNGFKGDTTSLKVSMLIDQVKGRTDTDAVFYRFIPSTNVDQERLTRFISLYMDKAGKDSNGYF